MTNTRREHDRNTRKHWPKDSMTGLRNKLENPRNVTPVSNLIRFLEGGPSPNGNWEIECDGHHAPSNLFPRFDGTVAPLRRPRERNEDSEKLLTICLESIARIPGLRVFHRQCIPS